VSLQANVSKKLFLCRNLPNEPLNFHRHRLSRLHTFIFQIFTGTFSVGSFFVGKYFLTDDKSDMESVLSTKPSKNLTKTKLEKYGQFSMQKSFGSKQYIMYMGNIFEELFKRFLVLKCKPRESSPFPYKAKK
jgi:hypothetical protein